MDKDTITTILAIWGAVLSSFAVGWQFFRDITQRGNLRVSCYIGSLTDGLSEKDPNDYLVYNITNVGKEPVMLTNIGGEMKKDHFLVNTRQLLPRMLQPGEYILDYTSDLSVLGHELKHLTAIDSLGRSWKAPSKQVKKLKEDFASGKYGKSKVSIKNSSAL
ncbi:MAG: hypothetical protein OEW20_10730 [Nitrospira sp.]|nr:hypothetical protein [Nitrospira sp.]